MRRLSLIPIALAAVAVPALLALGVHLAAGSSLTAPPAVVARVSTAPIAAPSTPPRTTTTSSDHCAEAEHRDDPSCAPAGTSRTTTSDDKSGRNSGSSDNSGSGNSGSGHSGSGRSGGDD